MDRNKPAQVKCDGVCLAVGLPWCSQLAQLEQLVPSGCASDLDPGV